MGATPRQIVKLRTLLGPTASFAFNPWAQTKAEQDQCRLRRFELRERVEAATKAADARRAVLLADEEYQHLAAALKTAIKERDENQAKCFRDRVEAMTRTGIGHRIHAGGDTPSEVLAALEIR